MNIVMSGRKIVLEGINSRADNEDAKISEGKDTATNTANKKHRMENIFKWTEHPQANSNTCGFTGCVLSTVVPSQLDMISDCDNSRLCPAEVPLGWLLLCSLRQEVWAWMCRGPSTLSPFPLHVSDVDWNTRIVASGPWFKTQSCAPCYGYKD